MRRFAIRVAALPAALLATMACLSAQAYDYTAPVPFHTLANFDPSNSVIPFPNNLLRLGSTDLTINAPLPSNPAQQGPVIALNALDGFSTVAPWSTTFSTALTASSVVGGASVRFFEVSTDAATGAVTGVKGELKSPQQFVATLASNAATGATLAIVPTAPLKPLTSYMAVVTNSVADAGGVPVHPSLVYLLAKRTSPLCVNGASTIPALPASESCALEPLRQLTNTQEAAASAAGVDASKIVISWTATTGSTYLPMQALTGLIDAVPATSIAVVPTGLDLSKANAALPPVADIYVGALTIPYYLSPPSQSNPTAPLTASWKAKAGGYVPPFDKAGLDPTSTNVTFANPLPVATSNQKIPVLVTLPNANSGKTKPASGWPVVIFQHGFTRNRTDAFGIAGGLAGAGFAVIAIDLPLHGLTDPTNPLYRNQLLTGSPAAGLITGERTFDVDYQNNDTGASGPDGKIDESGIYFFNPASLLTTRDNFRQGVADLLELRSAIPSVLALDGSAMFDSTRVSYAGQSLGGIEGTMFMALSKTPNTATQTGVLNVAGGGLVGLALGSPNIAPPILGGLAAAGLHPGTSDFNAFLVVAQTAVDAGDPINYAALTAGKNLLVQEVIGGSAPLAGDPTAAACPSCYDANGKWKSDQTVPNTSAGFPLSGTEPLIGALGLTSLTSTGQSATGLRAAVRFITGVHGSLLDPTSPQTTFEMQKQAITFIASGGTVVPITNTSVIKTSESPADDSDVAPSDNDNHGN
jgi:pimeloyl-ACP methyl ester carboxylesterase